MHLKVKFLAESAKAFAVTRSVLSFFDREPRRMEELDFQPFVDAMLALCREHGRDESGVGALRQFTEIFALIRVPSCEPTDEQFTEGLRNIDSYMRWVRGTFPERHGPERN